MKTRSLILFVAGILLAGCSSKELSKDEALTLLKKERGYPRVLDNDIYCGDEKQARKAIDKGLEKDGLVTIHRTLKFSEIGVVPIIEFTDKAKPYLLTSDEKDKKYKIQPVKVADEDITTITSIVSNNEARTATVTYTTVYKNITPFKVLMSKDLNKPKENNTATFMLSDQDGWILQKN